MKRTIFKFESVLTKEPAPFSKRFFIGSDESSIFMFSCIRFKDKQRLEEMLYICTMRRANNSQIIITTFDVTPKK